MKKRGIALLCILAFLASSLLSGNFGAVAASDIASQATNSEVKWNAITWNQDTFEMTYNEVGNAKQGVLKNPTSFDKTIFSLKFTFVDTTNTGDGLYFGANKNYGGVAFRRENDSTTGEDYLVIGNQVGNQGWTYSQLPWTAYKIYAGTVWGEGQTSWREKEFLLQIATEIVGDDVRFYIGINGELQKTKDGADYYTISGGASALGTGFFIGGDNHKGKPTAYIEHCYSATGTPIHDYANYTLNADGTETGHCVVEGCTATDTRQPEVKLNAITWNKDTFEMTYNDLGNAKQGVLKNPTSFDKTIFSIKFTFTDSMTSTGEGLYYGANGGYGGVAFRRESDSTTGEDYLVIGNQLGTGWTFAQFPWTVYKIFASEIWGEGETSWGNKEFLLQIATEIVEDDVKFYIGINGKLQKTKDGADYCIIAGGASALGTQFRLQGNYHYGKPTAYTEHSYSATGTAIHDYADYTPNVDGTETSHCVVEGCTATDTRQIEVKWNAITWNQDTFEMTYNDLGNVNRGVLKNPTSFDRTIFSLKFTFVDTTNTGDGLYYGTNTSYGGVAFRRENDSTTGEDYLVIGNQLGTGWTYSQLPWTAYKIYASTVWGDGQTSWREKEFLLQIATEIVEDDVRFYIGINGELQKTKDGADYYTISGGASALGTGFFIQGDNHKGKPTAYTEHCYNTSGKPIHNYDLRVVKDATCLEEGIKAGTCTSEGCSATSGNITFEAYGHKYVDSVCERCGAEQSIFDVAPYKEDGTHPIKNGSLFAGWYTGDNYGKETVYTEKTGTATAKFADAKLMNVAAQLAIYGTGEQQNVWKDGKTKMRLVFTLDSTDYHDVGFYVQFEGYSEGKYSSKTVFTKIVANENGVPFEYEPTNYLGDKSSESAKYFVTATITGIPETAADMNITITPYWVTLDGTEVKGEPTIKTVNQGIYAGNKYTGSDTLDENAAVANYSFATIGGTDVMPIVGYYGPALTEDKTVTTTSGTYTLPSHLTDAMFSKIAESGINTIGKNDLDYASKGCKKTPLEK